MNILLTGASRGIGAATRNLLAARGHQVIGHSTRGGGNLLGADLSEPGAAVRLWRDALNRAGGRIDVLINNAGIYEAAPVGIDDSEWLAQWQRTLQVNLVAAGDLSRQAILHFEAQGGGRIINVASRAAFRGDSADHWHYAASKAGMVAMTRSIARGYAAKHILAFAVAPGFTVSEMTEDYLAGRGGAAIIADIPLGRVTSTDEVAEAIRWLAIDAPAAATGTIVDLNGASYVR
ncbi:MAG TPA: SDR family oxidoreductase [Sphingomicrobium sp.]|nr:SDR family oxidoreductase [Sphingomicrobium sp.]